MRSPRGTITYREMDLASDRLSARLAAMGASKESLVALALPRGIDLLTSILATWKCGAGYLPLDLQHPSQRLEQVLELSGARILIVSTERPVQLTTTAERLELSGDARSSATGAEPRADAASAPGAAPAADDLAYVIYTSGSTGTPKGVAVTHRGLPNLAHQSSFYGMGSATRLLMFSPIGFDACVEEIATTIHAGGCLVVVPDEDLKDPARLQRAIEAERVDAMMAPPSFLTLLSAAACPTLSTVVVGGEICTKNVIEDWASRVRLVNRYGPTEVTVASTVEVCSPTTDPRCIGVPLPHYEVAVVDEALRPLPDGEIGEVVIGGIGVARGYWKDELRTSESFVSLPGAGAAFAHAFRSGDFGRILPDGKIEFHGRRDQQVKVAGNRIELGELESVTMATRVLLSCAAIPYSDDVGGFALFVVPRERGGDVEAIEAIVRAHLAERLPVYFTPRRILVLDDLVWNASGKIDRRRLRELLAQREEAVATPPPSSALSAAEAHLAGLWTDLLKRPILEPTANFFAVGGDSLSVMRLSARLRKEGVEVSVRQIFSAPVLKDMALLLGEGARS